jgi:hypothetical protein
MFKIKAHHILFGIFFIFYLTLSNKDQGFDSYSYALNIRAGVDLFHPHHLLYSYFANLIYRLFSFTGIDCLRLMAIVNSFLATITMNLIFRIINSRQSALNAIVCSMIIAFLYSFWYYATSLEVNMPALLFLILSLYWFLAKPETPSTYYFTFGFLAVATLFHQIAILAFVPLTIYLLFQNHSIKQVFLYLIPSIISVVGAYLLIGFSQIEHKTCGDFFYWLTSYSHLGAWGKLRMANFAVSVWGIVKTFVGGETIREFIYGENRSILQYIYVLIAIAFAAAYLFTVISSIRSGLKNMPARSWLLLSLFSIFALFAFWWAPTDDGFWLYAIVLLTVGIFYLGEKAHRPGLVCLILLILINIPFEITPAASAKNSIVIQGSDAFDRHNISANDLVFTNLIQVRLAYQYYRNIEVPTASLIYSDARNRFEAMANIQHLLKKSLTAERIFIFENELNPEPHRRFLFEKFSPQDYLQIYKPYYPYLQIVDSIPAYGKTIKIYQLVGLDSLAIDSLSGR